MLKVKRVYEEAEETDGARFLVDRLWPRGIKKEQLHMQAWLKEAAPSNELRQWFGHEPEKWAEFQRRYRAELEANPAAWKPLLEAAQHGDVTLLYSVSHTQLNNAVALRSFLEDKLAG